MRNEHGQADGEGRGEKEKEEGRIVAQKCSGEIDYGLRPREDSVIPRGKEITRCIIGDACQDFMEL